MFNPDKTYSLEYYNNILSNEARQEIEKTFDFTVDLYNEKVYIGGKKKERNCNGIRK